LIVPITVYALSGSPTGIWANELMLSCMAMTFAGSGLAYFILQNSEDYFIKGFLGICGIAFIGWIYFSLRIYNVKCADDDDDA